MPVITIAREFGAGGEAVGQILAQRLGYDLLDKALISEVARRLELSDADVESHDENPGSLLHRILSALGSAPFEFAGPPEIAAWSPPYADPAFDPGKAVLRLTQEVIREAARGGRAVIVGRASAYVLRDHPAAVHVFLRAAHPTRLAAVMESFDVDEEEARRRIKHTDANRAAYVRQIYNHDWAHPSHYDIVMDTGRLGYTAAADAVLSVVAHR